MHKRARPTMNAQTASPAAKKAVKAKEGESASPSPSDSPAASLKPNTNLTKAPALTMTPIGTCACDMEHFTFTVKIDKSFLAGLKHVKDFSHVHVYWWADKCDTKENRGTLQTSLPYAKGVKAGVFACRSPFRPNPICETVCKLVKVDEEKGELVVEYLDALDGSPILDIKPYIPVSDRVKHGRVASWFNAWPCWFEQAGQFFASHPELFAEDEE